MSLIYQPSFVIQVTATPTGNSQVDMDTLHPRAAKFGPEGHPYDLWTGLLLLDPAKLMLNN